jgi:hypothetical protein
MDCMRYSTCSMHCENCACPWTTIHLLWARGCSVLLNFRSEAKQKPVFCFASLCFVSFRFASTYIGCFASSFSIREKYLHSEISNDFPYLPFRCTVSVSICIAFLLAVEQLISALCPAYPLATQPLLVLPILLGLV